MHSTERGSKEKVQQLRMMGRDDGKKKKHIGELKSVTHAFHPRGPGGTFPG